MPLYQGIDGPVAANIMYAIRSTATTALPMSNIVCLSIATSLNSNRNLLQRKIPGNFLLQKIPQPRSALRRPSELNAELLNLVAAQRLSGHFMLHPRALQFDVASAGYGGLAQAKGPVIS